MALALSAFMAIAFLIAHAHYKPFRVVFGMSSALFWLLFAGAGFQLSSNFDLTNIYSYFALFGLGFTVGVVILTLAFNPTRQVQDEKREEEPQKKGTFIENMRERRGLPPRPLERK